jgi:hypothetical protein
MLAGGESKGRQAISISHWPVALDDSKQVQASRSVGKWAASEAAGRPQASMSRIAGTANRGISVQGSSRCDWPRCVWLARKRRGDDEGCRGKAQGGDCSRWRKQVGCADGREGADFTSEGLRATQTQWKLSLGKEVALRSRLPIFVLPCPDYAIRNGRHELQRQRRTTTAVTSLESPSTLLYDDRRGCCGSTVAAIVDRYTCRSLGSAVEISSYQGFRSRQECGECGELASEPCASLGADRDCCADRCDEIGVSMYESCACAGVEEGCKMDDRIASLCGVKCRGQSACMEHNWRTTEW